MDDTPLTDGTDLGRFYLRRLERFARLAHRPDVAAIPALQRLAGHATLGAYRDRVALGWSARRGKSWHRVRPAGVLGLRSDPSRHRRPDRVRRGYRPSRMSTPAARAS